MKFDIAILGAGPGGYSAAIRAAQLGAKVALIEKEEVGGVCLNRGCIPTKAIIASVKAIQAVRESAGLGITGVGNPAADIPAIIARKNNVVASLIKGIHQLIAGNKIEYIKGCGAISSNGAIKVGGRVIEAANIIIATGSDWRIVPGLEPDSKLILTSDHILAVEDIPESLAIVGGGVVGCEFASIFNALGTEVTIVEAMKNILPMEDEATSKYLERSFKKAGIRIKTGTTVASVRKNADSVAIALSDGGEFSAARMMVAVGRRPNIEGIGIEALGLKVENGAIVTDSGLRTSVRGIFAVGDVNGKYMLAHVASREGAVAAENCMDRDASVDYRAIPRPVYTDPEVCCIGATARELSERNVRYKTGVFGFGAASKAICDGRTKGQVTIYSDEGGNKILGAQIIGDHATELGGEITLAIANNLGVDAVSKTIHSHPTLSEAILEAALDCRRESVHKLYK